MSESGLTIELKPLRTCIYFALAFGAGCTAVILASFRNTLFNGLWTVIAGSGSTLRIAAIALVLLNLKNIPLVWHVWHKCFKIHSQIT